MNTTILQFLRPKLRARRLLPLWLMAAVPALAQPSWYDSVAQKGIEPGSPDFYQHQLNETDSSAGVCTWIAYEDAMYYDHNNNFPNLYADNPADWLSGMLTNALNIVNTPTYSVDGSTATFMSNWIASPGGRSGYASQLGLSIYGNPTDGSYSSYNTVTSSLLAGSNVLVRILPGSNTNQWWRYHVLDVVGFNAMAHTVVVLDPDNNQYGGYGFKGVTPFNYVPYSTNTTPNISSIIETGQWSQVGSTTGSLMQQYTVDSNGNITDGVYAGTQIQWVYDIGPVPEPSALALGLTAAALLGARRLRSAKRAS